MLKLGASQDWKDALEAITGQRELSAQPLIKYFEPLMDWLKDYNSKLPESDRTWTDACPPADELVKVTINTYSMVTVTGELGGDNSG